MAAPQLYIGLMSGTSMDGIDAVLADFSDSAQLIAHHSCTYPNDLLDRLRQAASGTALTAAEWLQLDQEIGEAFARCANELLESQALTPKQITAIGSHGQTLWHAPDINNSWQCGNPNLIAARTGITTVADIRRMDMAYGGQGAPLVPAFHQQLFSAADECRIVLNLGGIANITMLAPAADVIGYDTGPANCLLDAHYRQQHSQAYDRNGEWAASGQVNHALLQALLDEPYFQQPAPKSTGLETFNWEWLTPKLEQHPCEGANLQATLAALTATTVANEIKPHQPNRVIACGGGVFNRHLMTQLEAELGEEITLESSANYGVDPQQIEALAFAWLAKQRLAQTPGNLPNVTGARQACCLGAVYLPNL